MTAYVAAEFVWPRYIVFIYQYGTEPNYVTRTAIYATNAAASPRRESILLHWPEAWALPEKALRALFRRLVDEVRAEPTDAELPGAVATAVALRNRYLARRIAADRGASGLFLEVEVPGNAGQALKRWLHAIEVIYARYRIPFIFTWDGELDITPEELAEMDAAAFHKMSLQPTLETHINLDE